MSKQTLPLHMIAVIIALGSLPACVIGEALDGEEFTSLDDMGDTFDVATSDQAEVDLQDAVGDDWGDAALDETRQLQTQRLTSKNRRLQAMLTQLQASNHEAKQRLQLASRGATEARHFGIRIEQSISSMLRVGRGKDMITEVHPIHPHARLGDSKGVPEGGKQSGQSLPGQAEESGGNIASQLAALGVQPSNETLGQDLLNDAIKTGEGDVKQHAYAGIFCTSMVEERLLRDTACNPGSKLSCNSMLKYCQLERTDGVVIAVVPHASCYEGGVLACEKAREKLGAVKWLAQKKQQHADAMKVAMADAWSTAKYQERKRNSAAAKAKKVTEDAVEHALAQGEEMVNVATLKGNAPLPIARIDKAISQLKTEMRDMKFELMDKEKIFLGLKHVSPGCNDRFEACAHECDKTHTESFATEAVAAIMGKVTKCQMQCKEKVVDCVMNFVSGAFKDVTAGAMSVANQNGSRTS